MTATPVSFPISSGPWSGTAPKVVVVPINEAGAAGTYTITLPVKAGTMLLDVIFNTKVLWGAGTSATLDVGDTFDPKGYMNDVNIKTTPALVDKAVHASAGSVGTYTGCRYYDADDYITATVVTVGTTSSVGRSFLTFVYSPNVPTLNTPTQA